MAGKLNKSTKQILSVLFHLVVLACMVMLFDLVKPLIDKLNPGEIISSVVGKEEPAGKETPVERESVPIQREGAAFPAKPDKGGGAKKTTGGTTMADLMAQKKEQQQKKAEQQKKDE